MNLSLIDLLTNPEKHQGGTINRVADLQEKKEPAASTPMTTMSPEDAAYEAARRSLEKRHPHIHRKLLNLD